MSSKAKARALVQTKLSFGKRDGSLSNQGGPKKPRLDQGDEVSPSESDLKSKSLMKDDDEKDQGVSKEDEMEASNPQPPNTPGSPTSEPIASNPSQPKLPLPKPPPSTSAPPASTLPSPRRIHLTHKTGDLFAAPPNALLIHACNALGSWGGGIAKAFRTQYPDAYAIYRAHCQRSVPHYLVGTALLIAPRGGARKQHYIGCLFTSKGHGRGRDAPDKILRATGPAMKDLLRQVVREGGVGEMRMCRINSGLFAVPWEESKAAIEGLELGEAEAPGDGGPVRIVVYVPE